VAGLARPEMEEALRRRRAEMGDGYDVDLRRRILVGHWPPITYRTEAICPYDDASTHLGCGN